VLGAIRNGRGFAELLVDSDERIVGEHAIRVLGLPALIREKTELGRPKDLAMLAVLRRTLAERGE
jgi:hypothetical protein